MGESFAPRMSVWNDGLQEMPVEWFVDRSDRRAFGVVDRMWKEKAGFIWLESRLAAETLSWICYAYGDDVAKHSTHFEFTDFANPYVRKSFASWYPTADGFLCEYERLAKDMLEKHAAHAELRYETDGRYLDLRFGVRLGAKAAEIREDMLKRAFEALVECDADVQDFNRRIGYPLYAEPSE